MSEDKRNRKSNAGEIAVRIMCFLLGVLLTLSGVLIKERFFNGIFGAGSEEPDRAQMAEVTEAPEPTAEPEETAEEEVEVDLHEVAAETLYKEFVETSQVTATEPVEPDDNGAYIIDDKESKINWNTEYPALAEEMSLEEHAARETSYDTTLTANAFDKKVIESSTIDFSGVKITIMGDSITAATNLSEEEQAQYNYPKLLADILGCEVVNLGIGGSVVSRNASNSPMVERWSEIPEDSDVIIIFGGTNDCLYMNKWDFGHIEYDLRMNSGTFCGDLDEMCSAIKWKYRDNTDKYVKFIYVNPMSTILNDGVYATDPGNMVEQNTFAQAINEIVPPYGFDVIDLYNSNFMNSHDWDVNHEFVTDGVHPNPAGYQILAEHLASQIIQRINQ
ncbi:MAG: SGNH/GDSL hydrolase family protein [Lachnospiraceae bacterium]|nr:SGNH/GDSL hydrolase family protein [Lachnospiraceae bacterium]